MRTINEIILHCSATIEGKDYTVSDIDRWHKARGFKGIGYHFVVYRDGTVVAGRPIEQVGAHCTDHNANTIGICYIGGLSTDGKAKDTRTQAQKDSLLDLVFLLMEHYNITKENIHCHNDYAAKACPSFKREDFINELDEAFPTIVIRKQENKINIKL